MRGAAHKEVWRVVDSPVANLALYSQSGLKKYQKHEVSLYYLTGGINAIYFISLNSISTDRFRSLNRRNNFAVAIRLASVLKLAIPFC